MLTIRKEQMEALNAVMRERFIEKTMRHLRDLFPEETKPLAEPDLRAFVEDGMKRAGGYSIVSEREVTLFIDLMMGLGKDFEAQPNRDWIKRVLVNPEFDEQEKIDVIYQRLQATK
jgi:hypothetical protein